MTEVAIMEIERDCLLGCPVSSLFSMLVRLAIVLKVAGAGGEAGLLGSQVDREKFGRPIVNFNAPAVAGRMHALDAFDFYPLRLQRFWGARFDVGTVVDGWGLSVGRMLFSLLNNLSASIRAQSRWNNKLHNVE
ncbi:hypothetical protein N5D28_20755 [Stutzerimonas stutzeri]|uniref:hypothetical protein n=1 Tax=Stutzerimonas stutzeri TaxID=316 RepID=UPI002447A626|nr:hypothetical protein [Stutzerimonas stutzeri]MDH0611314.1 hypothetical protein [Stutzerimonas stutzeri]